MSEQRARRRSTARAQRRRRRMSAARCCRRRDRRGASPARRRRADRRRRSRRRRWRWRARGVAHARASTGTRAAATPLAGVARADGAAPARSPPGLPLGQAPARAAGIARPADDPVQSRFTHPPRAGLLFNLGTGQVLWQRNPLARLRIASLTKMMTALLDGRAAPPRRARARHQARRSTPPARRSACCRSASHVRARDAALRPAAALGQRRRGRARPARRRHRQRVRRAHERARRPSSGWAARATPRRSGYFDKDNYSCAADLADARPRRPRTAAHRARRRAPTRRSLPFPIKGGKLYLYNNNPLLIYGYPGTTGLKTGYTMPPGVPRRHRRAPRRAPRRRAAALARPGHPGARAARPRLPRRLPPAAGARAADPGERVARARAARRPARATPAAAAEEYRSCTRLTGQSAKKENAVDLDDTPEQAAYRAQVRGWLEEHKPEAPVLAGPGSARGRGRRSSPRGAPGRASSPRAASPGVTWPKEYGGQGLGPIEQVICNQEIAPRRKCPGSSTRSASACSARRSSRTAPRSRRRATSGRCCTATRSGASCSPSPPPARTSRPCRRARASRTTAAGG